MVTEAARFHKRFLIRILKFLLGNVYGNGGNSDKHFRVCKLLDDQLMETALSNEC